MRQRTMVNDFEDIGSALIVTGFFTIFGITGPRTLAAIFIIVLFPIYYVSRRYFPEESKR